MMNRILQVALLLPLLVVGCNRKPSRRAGNTNRQDIDFDKLPRLSPQEGKRYLQNQRTKGKQAGDTSSFLCQSLRTHALFVLKQEVEALETDYPRLQVGTLSLNNYSVRIFLTLYNELLVADYVWRDAPKDMRRKACALLDKFAEECQVSLAKYPGVYQELFEAYFESLFVTFKRCVLAETDISLPNCLNVKIPLFEERLVTVEAGILYDPIGKIYFKEAEEPFALPCTSLDGTLQTTLPVKYYLVNQAGEAILAQKNKKKIWALPETGSLRSSEHNLIDEKGEEIKNGLGVFFNNPATREDKQAYDKLHEKVVAERQGSVAWFENYPITPVATLPDMPTEKTHFVSEALMAAFQMEEDE